MKSVILISLLLILLVLILPSVIGLSLIELFRGRVEPAEVDFSSLERPDSPNHYLLAPEEFAPRPDKTSPIFPVPVDRLKSEWIQLIESQPRTRKVEEYSPHRIQWVQRSLLFRFPDVITVQFIEISGKRSTLALYSRSIYGYSDLGVNQKRVESWIQLLRTRLSQKK